MLARDVLVKQVRRIELVEAPAMTTDSKAAVSMLWARTRPICLAGASVEGKRQGEGSGISSRTFCLYLRSWSRNLGWIGI